MQGSKRDCMRVDAGERAGLTMDAGELAAWAECECVRISVDACERAGLSVNAGERVGAAGLTVSELG